ncbi:helix-turn-helix domain-containing protein [Catellatospora sp. NPDC049609]|uniref:helix-turn-helix domain-containing protein n=1 Tax=Catellatospora sp. NPDC049609 TaxID=3155505 RepID=UPI0034484978
MVDNSTPAAVGKRRRIVGDERVALGADLVRRYTAGESIRALAAATGRSYGFVHRVLAEAGVQLRKRGGPRRRKATAEQGAAAPGGASGKRAARSVD